MSDIVYVDNQPDLSLNSEQRKCFYILDYTEDEDDNDAFLHAKKANLWVFDFFLVNPSNANERLENGLSLFHKWRSALNRDYPPVAVVSGNLEDALGSPLGPQARLHIQAQALGVEWLGDKTAPNIVDQLMELATACNNLSTAIKAEDPEGDPETFVPINVDKLCFDFLRAPRDVPWKRSAERQVDRARPPRIVTSATGVGSARLIMAWLLHRILPYPSFLLNEAHAALRLGLTIETFKRLNEEGNSPLSDSIKQARYQGPLNRFHGDRWWRAGIDNITWTLSQNYASIQDGLTAVAGEEKIDFIVQNEPVVLSDSDLVETNTFVEAKECVRATDDDFPSDVDPAWVLISSVKEDKKLLAKVVFEDLELVGGDSEN